MRLFLTIAEPDGKRTPMDHGDVRLATSTVLCSMRLPVPPKVSAMPVTFIVTELRRTTLLLARSKSEMPVSLPVDSPPIPDSRPPTSNHYLWLRPLTFPAAGCWLVSVAVAGHGVGAAIIPITAPTG